MIVYNISMKKILEFLKNNTIIVKWTIWYFFIIWLITKYIFKFDMFSAQYWWKFFHATLHGFGGLVFGFLIYAMIPLYIATTIITWHKKELIIPVPFENTISNILSKLFWKKTVEPQPEAEPAPEEQKQDEIPQPEYPSDLPPELRVPFMRAKNNLPLTGAISVYNQQTIKKEPEAKANSAQSDIPIPMDFDISDSINEDINDSVPTFTDIDFDTPIATEQELENNTTKYLTEKNIEYETYHDFVATEKFVIYEHNDEDFWIMDGDSWFATGKQKDSPIPELIELAKQNDLRPVLYLHSKNIMNIDSVIENFESLGITVIKDLDELN